MTPKHLTIAGRVLAALGLLLVAAGPVTDRFWSGSPGADTLASFAALGDRLTALRDARRARDDQPTRFDALVRSYGAGLGVDTPPELSRAVEHLERAAADERRQGARGADVDLAIAEIDVALREARRPTLPPAWLEALTVLGIPLIVVGISLLERRAAAYRKERRHVASLAGLPAERADDGRLAECVKETLYAERLRAARAHAPVASDAPSPARLIPVAAPEAQGLDRPSRAGAELPALPVPDLLFDPPAPETPTTRPREAIAES